MVSENKSKMFEQAVKLLEDYDVIFAAELFKMKSQMLQDLRKELRRELTLKCIKNNILRKAMEKLGFEGADEFIDRAPGSNIYIFSNENPFKLALMLRKRKVRVFARPGDVALEDIVIPAGNTGLAPGPFIGKLATLGVRTRIEGGTIWVNFDTKVASAGDKISQDLSEILTRLGIKAGEMGLEAKAAYWKGRIIPREELTLDVEEYRNQLRKAVSEAFQVALRASYPTPQSLPVLISMAAQNAERLALRAEFIDRDTVGRLIALAYSHAASLESLVGRRVEESLASAS